RAFITGSPVNIGVDAAMSAQVTIMGSTVTGTRIAGIRGTKAHLVIETATIRRTSGDPDTREGGVGVQMLLDARMQMTRSLVADHRKAGLLIDNSDAQVSATIVRGTQPELTLGSLADGVAIFIGTLELDAS